MTYTARRAAEDNDVLANGNAHHNAPQETAMTDMLPADFSPHYGVALDDSGSMNFYSTEDEARRFAALLVNGETLPVYRISYERIN